MNTITNLRSRSSLAAAMLALALGAGACTAADSENATSVTTPGVIDIDSSDINLTAGLETYQSCDALLGRLKSEGLERVGPYGFNQGGWYGPMFGVEDDEATSITAAAGEMATDAGSDAPTSGTSNAGEGGAASGTNNQEAGVDESDLVKTDGKRMVIALGSKLRVIDLATDTIEREIELGQDYYGGELFLSGETAIVMTQGWTDTTLTSDGFSLPNGSPTTRILQVDLGTGEVGRTLEFEGNYLSSRDIDGSIRIALWAGVGNLEFLYPSGSASEDRATANNKAIIEESTIEQWLPSYRLLDGDDVIESGAMFDCNRMFVPGEFSGFGSLTILTITADRELQPLDATAVLSDGQTVYSSTDRMAVATARWPEYDNNGQPVADETFNTLIHSFDITDPTTTNYVASGSVDGHLLSQYSLSEFDGKLRVATTAGDPWNGQDSSESFITVLAENGQTLDTVGKVGGIGEGERIYAVRFMDEMAYVVTFRQVDPLYAIDLSDPANPTVLGELKIPGFSAYLHPVADGLLMGVGQAGTDDGFTTGSQVSLFDVSDPQNPQRIDQLDLGDQAHSQVEWDAKAFTWWDPTTTGFVPISWYRYDEGAQTEENGTASVAISVQDRRLVETGRIEHEGARECELDVTPMPLQDDSVPAESESSDAETSLVETAPAPSDPSVGDDPGNYCWTWTPEIRRTVIANDRIYTISDSGVMISDLTSFAPQGWLAFAE